MSPTRNSSSRGAQRTTSRPKWRRRSTTSFSGSASTASTNRTVPLTRSWPTRLPTSRPITTCPSWPRILTNEVNDTDSLIRYITECRESGVVILPPDVNESAKAFTIVDDKIRYGLLGIKGVGEAALDSILGAGEECGGFSSFTHFCSLVDSRKVNKKVVECLIKAGAFDCMGLKRSQLFALVQDKWDRLSKKNGKNSLQMDIFGTDTLRAKEEEIPETEELDHAEILKGEKEAFGFFFSQHPLSAYEHIISPDHPPRHGQHQGDGDERRCDHRRHRERMQRDHDEEGRPHGEHIPRRYEGHHRGDRLPRSLSKNSSSSRATSRLVVTGLSRRPRTAHAASGQRISRPFEDIQNELDKDRAHKDRLHSI